MDKKIDGLYKEIEEIKQAEYVKTDNDPLKQLEEELIEGMEDAEGEELVIEDPELINEQADDEYAVVEIESTLDAAGVVMPQKGRPKNPLDTNSALDELKKLKPMVAKVQDAKLRKQMSDSMARMIRQTYGISKRGSNGGYAAIQRAKSTQAKFHNDNAKNKVTDFAALQAKLEEKRLGKK